MRKFSGLWCLARGALAIAAVLFVSTGSFSANAQPGDYAAEYKAYNDAIAKGDNAAASSHAHAAWQAAEEKLGDHKTTAVLAYNYGQYVLFDDTAAALPALERAKALQDAGVAALPVADLDVFLAYAAFKASGEKKQAGEKLRATLEARDAGDHPPNFESASIWLHMALHELNKKKYEDAKVSAARAEASINAALPGEYQSRAQAIIIGGAALLLPRPRELATIDAAHTEFDRARRLFPIQKDIDSFDPVLAQVMAWDTATHAVLISDVSESIAKETMEKWPEGNPIFENEIDPDECAGDWSQRPHPNYPTRANSWGYIGGVTVGFNIGEDGRVRDARILAEVPGSVFGKFVLKAMRRWIRERPLDPRPGCTTNLINSFAFMMK